MARWHYPKWRRITMQVVLCLTFCGSLALAQWVVHDRRVNGNTSLEREPIILGPIAIRGPRGWEIRSQAEHPVRYLAVEPGSGEKDGRTLLIRECKVRVGMPITMFLGPVSGIESGLASQPIKIGNLDGILTDLQSRADTEMAPESGEIQNQWIAGAVSPTGIAISVQLKGTEETQAQRDADKLLIRQICREIQITADSNGR